MANKGLILPSNRLFNNSNIASAGGSASLYLSGTLTPANFLDANGTSLGPTITANAIGQLPDAYGDETVAYRLILKDGAGAQLDGGDIDPFYFGLVTGSDAAVSVGTTTTGAAGSSASVTNSGTASAAILDFTIPTGAQGPAGDVAKVASRTELASIVGPTDHMVRYFDGSPWEFYTAARYNTEYGRTLTTVVAAHPTNVPGIVVPPSSDTTGASGAWVRKFDHPIRLKWFGAVYGDNSGANATANNTAITACLNVANALKITPVPQTVSAMPDIDLGVGVLEISSTINITSSMGSVKIIGHGTSHAGSSTIAAGATVIKTYGCTGFQFDYTRCSLSDVTIVGDFSGTEAEYHGVSWTQLLYLTNVKVLNCRGDGFNVVSGTSKFPDCSRLLGCEAWYCRDGYSFGVGSGVNADCNVIQVIGGLCNLNRRWGTNDNSFLGNSYFGWECASNSATSYNDGVSIGASKVVYNGYTYFAISGQETGASTNAPSGTTADNTWWAYKSGSGSDTASASSGKPAWSSGILVRAGGSVRDSSITAQNVFSGCYAESDQGWAQITYPSVVSGGVLSTLVWKGSSGAVLTVDSGSMLNQKIGGYKVNAYTGTDESVSAQLGERATTKTILAANSSTGAPLYHRLRYISNTTGDILFDYQNASPAYQIMGPNTTEAAGTSGTVPHAFRPTILLVQPYTTSQSSSARRFMIDAAAPTTGSHGQGEWVLYRGSTAGLIGYNCTSPGTPGTWQTVYGMTAAKQSAWSAWTGTASRATKDTSTATLGDVASALKALVDDLQARGVLA